MESTEAAAKFFLDPRSVPDVLAALPCLRIQDLPEYEPLIGSESIGGLARRPTFFFYARYL